MPPSASRSTSGSKRSSPPPAHFLNRELGLLEFNRRVLAQAADDAVPLLERLRFLCIVSSNLDEFFEIRVAGLKEQIKLEIPEPGPDGARTAGGARRRSRRRRTSWSREQYRLLNEVLLPAARRSRASVSCAAPTGRPRSASGYATTSSAR